MSVISLFHVDFRFVKAAAAGQSGSAYQYARDRRRVKIAAASGHPKDILAVLNADLTVPAGEVIEILAVQQDGGLGTEGNIVYS